MEHGLAQPGLGGTAHDDDACFAAALGHGRHARQRPEGRVVPARERAAGLGEQGGKRAPADAGQRRENGGVAWCVALCRRSLGQGGAQFVELALGLMELVVGRAQPRDKGAQM